MHLSYVSWPLISTACVVVLEYDMPRFMSVTFREAEKTRSPTNEEDIPRFSTTHEGKNERGIYWKRQGSWPVVVVAD